MKVQSIVTITTLALLSGCAQTAPYQNQLVDPQLKVLEKEGISSSLQIFSFEGCKAKGFKESFDIAKKMDLISLKYVGTLYNEGQRADTVAYLAKQALVESGTKHNELLKYVGQKADKMGCKSQERKAYNMILESAVYKSPIDFIFNQDRMLAQSKLSQLGSK